MALPRKLIDKLCCPRCGSGLNYLPSSDRLDCQGCDVSYRVTDDIPVLQADEAEKVER